MSFMPLIRASKGGITHPDLTAAYGPGAALTIRCEVSHLQSNTQPPHFSVTGEVYTAASRRQRDIAAGGCLHDEALRYWPESAPLVALHLSHATDGQPTHAEANGFYWLAGALGGLGERFHGGQVARYEKPRTAEDCLRIFADHVRLPLDEARSLSQRLDQDTHSTQRGACPKCSDGLDARGACCSDCAGTGRENVARFTRRRWQEECRDMAPRWKREADAGLLWLWEHATPSDQRHEWHKRVREVLGVELPWTENVLEHA